MVTEIIFLISGFMIAVLLAAKIWEGRKHKPFFLLALISRSDRYLRFLSQEGARRYSEERERLDLMVRKQLPLKARSSATKVNTLIQEKSEKIFGNIRGSRFLKKSDGISEFFKNMSEMESEGRIDDMLENPNEGEIGK